MLRHLVPAGVDVRPRLESTVLVAADATQLHQVVLNLGTNAGLAMRDTAARSRSSSRTRTSTRPSPRATRRCAPGRACASSCATAAAA